LTRKWCQNARGNEGVDGCVVEGGDGTKTWTIGAAVGAMERAEIGELNAKKTKGVRAVEPELSPKDLPKFDLSAPFPLQNRRRATNIQRNRRREGTIR